MKFDLIKGRLGTHRFHSMLVHFPSGLYPFSLVMDVLAIATASPDYSIAGKYALIGACATSALAIIYGAIDFLQIPSNDPAWRKAGIHALLNITWFIIFSSLLFYRLKHGDEITSWTYLGFMSVSTAGLFFSNFLGADLIISHHVGIASEGIIKRDKDKTNLPGKNRQ